MQVSLSLLAGLQRGRRWRFPTEEMWRTPFVTCWGGCAPPALTWAQPSSKSWAREPLSSASHNRPAKCSLSREHTRTHARWSHCSISSCFSGLSVNNFCLETVSQKYPNAPISSAREQTSRHVYQWCRFHFWACRCEHVAKAPSRRVSGKLLVNCKVGMNVINMQDWNFPLTLLEKSCCNKLHAGPQLCRSFC